MDCLDFLFSDETPVPSPCFVLDEARLAANAAILDELLTKWEEMGYRFESVESLFA